MYIAEMKFRTLRCLLLLWAPALATADTSALSVPSVCSDSGGHGGVSLLQSSKSLWKPATNSVLSQIDQKADSAEDSPAPPAESSLDQVLGPLPLVDLSAAFNYSVVENISGIPENLTEPDDVVMVKSIKGASPMSIPMAGSDPSMATHLRDCLMGLWSEWSECLVARGTGFKGPHQIRQRSIVQPWLPGGAPCLPQLEGRECNVKKFR